MEDNQIFKVPQLPKPDQKTARQNQTDSNKAEFAHATKEENQQKQQQQQQPRGIPKLDYTAPENRTEPERPYYLQAIKEGKIVQEVELDVDQDYFVVGRLPNCDVPLEHPSISRYHAVIQFCKDGNGYLFDLNSTHKTYLNKKPIEPKKYTIVRPGDMVRFGASSRIFVFGTHDEKYNTDQELARQQEQEQIRRKNVTAREKNAEQMVREAERHEELKHGIKEKKYLTDPKRALQRILALYGYTMEFEVEQEEGMTRQFVAKIQIPADVIGDGDNAAELSQREYGQDTVARFDGNDDVDSDREMMMGMGSMVAIGKATKKKEAVHMAALDACELLDKAGVFERERAEAGGIHRRRKGLKVGDDYDDEDDEYYDRTISSKDSAKSEPGSLSVKKGRPGIETYESLAQKIDNLYQKKNEIQSSILEIDRENQRNENKGGRRQNKGEDDEIDDIIYGLQRQSNSKRRQELEHDLKELEKQIAATNALLQIAKPTRSTDMVVAKPVVSYKTDFVADEHHVVESRNNDVSDNNHTESAGEKTENLGKNRESTQQKTLSFPLKPPHMMSGNTYITTDTNNHKRPAPSDLVSGLDKHHTQSSAEKDDGRDVKDQSKKFKYQEFPEYEEWKPPAGQSGDGRTSLNDKYGY